MKVKEGSCLSFLGLVSLDLETGDLTMNKLVAVLAGGMAEAKRCVKHELQKARYYTMALAAAASISLFVAGSILY